VSKVDFADKSLNQTARIAKVKKTQKVNKAQKIKIDYAYGSSSNQIQMLNGQAYTNKTIQARVKLLQ
jgi:hypothetical protein